jgi:DNA polymerase-3 subunit beta
MNFNPGKILPFAAACAALAERNTNKESLRGICVQGACKHLAATDLETSLISAQFCWEKGWVLVPAGKLLGALRAIGDREAQWIIEAETLIIKAPGSRFTLPLLPKGDYPILSPGKRENVIQPVAADLVEALEKVASCCATESARYTMTGIHMDGGKVIATDGKRLAVADIAKHIPLVDHPVATIPSKLVGILKAVFHDGENLTLAVAISTNTVDFIGGDFIVTTRQIEGRYPDYKAILPRIIAHQIETDPGPLLDALRRVGFMVARESFKIDLNFTLGTLTLTVKNEVGGDATAQVDFAWTDKPLTLSVNPKFLTELLRGAGSGPVTIGINTKDKPMVITAKGYTGLIMPLV